MPLASRATCRSGTTDGSVFQALFSNNSANEHNENLLKVLKEYSEKAVGFAAARAPPIIWMVDGDVGWHGGISWASSSTACKIYLKVTYKIQKEPYKLVLMAILVCDQEKHSYPIHPSRRSSP